jgi:hypothetical protein
MNNKLINFSSKPNTPGEVGAWKDESPKGTGAWQTLSTANYVKMKRKQNREEMAVKKNRVIMG